MIEVLIKLLSNQRVKEKTERSEAMSETECESCHHVNTAGTPMHSDICGQKSVGMLLQGHTPILIPLAVTTKHAPSQPFILKDIDFCRTIYSYICPVVAMVRDQGLLIGLFSSIHKGLIIDLT